MQNKTLIKFIAALFRKDKNHSPSREESIKYLWYTEYSSAVKREKKTRISETLCSMKESPCQGYMLYDSTDMMF